MKRGQLETDYCHPGAMRAGTAHGKATRGHEGHRQSHLGRKGGWRQEENVICSEILDLKPGPDFINEIWRQRQAVPLVGIR